MGETLVQTVVNELFFPRCSRKSKPPLDGRCRMDHTCCTECNYCFGKYIGFSKYKPSKRRNYPLERLCFSIILKCSYAAAGCHFTGIGTEVCSHEKICDFSLKPCPRNHISKTCSWLGLGKDMKRHCELVHPVDVLKGHHFMVSIKLEDFVNNDSTTLISAYDTLFCCTWHLCTKFKTAYFSVVYFGQKFRRNRYSYEMNLMRKCKETDTFKRWCSHSPGFHRKFLGEYDFFMPMKSLKEICFDSGYLTFTLEITKDNLARPIKEPSTVKGTPGQSIEEAILAELECPVCFGCISPPIRQCKKGHQLCKDCFELVRQCPLCQHEKSNSYNHGLAYFFDLVELPCRNAYNGCEFRAKGQTILEHETSCKFAPVKKELLDGL